MKLTKTYEMDIRIEKDRIIVSDLPTLMQVMGTATVSGNLHYYGIEKKDNKFIIPKIVFLDRLSKLRNDSEKIYSRILFMEQIEQAIINEQNSKGEKK